MGEKIYDLSRQLAVAKIIANFSWASDEAETISSTLILSQSNDDHHQLIMAKELLL